MAWRFAVCSSLFFLFSGCQSLNYRPDIEGLEFGYQGYDDIPVPRDFKFDENHSWAYRRYENSALHLRSCELRYVGDEDVGQLINWYAAQMRHHGWKQQSLNKDRFGRRATLVFHKEDERALVDIERKAAGRHPEPYTVVTISVGPLPGLSLIHI